MIILYAIPGEVLLFLAAVMFLGSVVFAIWYSIMQAKEESKNISVTDLSVGKRVAILLNVIAVFASIFAVAYGFINYNGIVGTIGILSWITTSLIVAYVCSPLRLISDGFQNSSGLGCAYIFFVPLIAIVASVSMIIIMLISWIFGLIAVLKGLSKKVYIIIGVSIVLLVVAGIGLNLYQQDKARKEQEYNFQLVEKAYEQVLQDIEIGALKKIDFDEETKLALEYCGIKSFFNETEIREAIANKFAKFYNNKDVDGLINFLMFIDANHIRLISENEVYDVCFSNVYQKFLKKYITENGICVNDIDNIYSYNGAEFWLKDVLFIEFEYTIDGEKKSCMEILGDQKFRKEQHEEYDEHSPGYFLVAGQNVRLVEDVCENSEDFANKYYPAATCPRCGTSFRENTMRARMIADHGYCGMGLCGNN